ncbi:competence protein, partial [Streptococcus danieliae]|nr:competence protein [Streptococcus danieliae]
KKDFSLEINLLHGDDKKLLGSNFYIMTCHQLFHYYKFFDLIIVDEVDAFPYNGNDVLEYGMKKALKDQAPLIFLSATPSKKIKKSV